MAFPAHSSFIIEDGALRYPTLVLSLTHTHLFANVHLHRPLPIGEACDCVPVISIAISVDFYMTFNVVSESMNTTPGVVKSDNRQ
jgi:hypothetical protein